METRICQNCKKDFVIEPEDFAFYKKMDVPPPTWCPECRLIRRILAYGKRTLYKRKCDLCGEVKFSMYSQDNPIKVYCNTCWWSDKWDAAEYARDYDFSRPFFEQYRELLLEVPWMMMGRHEPTMINSEYSNCATNLRNCYLVFFADYVEDSSYCDTIHHAKDCIDCYMTQQSENCYEGVNLVKCYQAKYCIDCEDSFNISFSKDLVGCSNCFGCVNLRKKQYCIFNEQYSKEEYEKKVKEFDVGSFSSSQNLIAQITDYSASFPVRFSHGRHNTASSGDYVSNSKNAINVYNCENLEDCKNCFIIYMSPSKDCHDYSFYGENANLFYECLKSGGGSTNLKFSNGCFPGCRNLTLCNYCIDSHDLFACIGLRGNKSFSIFNKQYSEDEYKKLAQKILEQMNTLPYTDKVGREYRYGEFFPPELSPFSYNDTVAQEYFPLKRESAQTQGYNWTEQETKTHIPTLKVTDIPDNIMDVDDTIINEVIECSHRQQDCNESCTTAFRITKKEPDFYRTQHLPIPRLCSNCRHYSRLAKRGPLKLWHRRCMKEGCSNEFETSYSSDRPEVVYCESCYQREVV